jgi:hypothetical protein
MATTIESLEQRVELNENYLNAVVRGYEKLLRAAEHVLAGPNTAGTTLFGLKEAVRDARRELNAAKGQPR